MATIYFWVFVCVLVAIFPKDALLLPYWVEAQIKLHYVNAKMFWFAWGMYRKMKKDASAAGLRLPPFKFVPIWDRDNLK